MSTYLMANLNSHAQAARRWSSWVWYLSRNMLNMAADPCNLVLAIPVKACRIMKTNLRRRRQWPKPLSRRRHRRKVQTNITGEHLGNAGIFARLPCELRLRIYEYVLGGRQINIVHCPRKRRLAHRCQVYDPGNLTHNTRSAKNQCAGECWSEPPCNMGPLLRTCRLIYSEATEVLYTRNSFGVCHMDGMATFVCFSRTIRPERLASITRLTIVIQDWWCIIGRGDDILRSYQHDMYASMRNHAGFLYPHAASRDPDRQHPWRQMWRIIAKEMTGLRELNLRLLDWSYDSPQKPLTLDIGATWVFPILQVPGLENFSLKRLAREGYDDASVSRVNVSELETGMKERLYAKSRPARREQVSRR